MSYVALGHRLPGILTRPLFGDRVRHGLIADEDDPMWREWMETSVVFYNANQRESVGRTVNRAGHTIMSGIELQGKRVLELGPGALDHMHSWTAEPEHFTCVDIDKSYLDLAVARLDERGVSHDSIFDVTR